MGTGALVVERKFIHGLGLVGHIEDIAVSRDQQGKKLGLRIIQALDAVGERVGCYKVCWVSFLFFSLSLFFFLLEGGRVGRWMACAVVVVLRGCVDAVGSGRFCEWLVV